MGEGGGGNWGGILLGLLGNLRDLFQGIMGKPPEGCARKVGSRVISPTKRRGIFGL